VDLSIVIVSWNTRDITRECLRSVFDNLGRLDAEVWVVDNASEDGSADMVAEEFPQASLIRNDTNRGFAAGNNQAIAPAQGRYVLLLNSDTVVLGDVLTESVRYMDAHADVGVMGCRVLNPDRTMQETCFMLPSLLNVALLTSGLAKLNAPFFGRERYRGWRRNSEREVGVVTGCYMMCRRGAIEQVGPLDETFFFCGEETDWCRRFRAGGWRLMFAPVGEIVHIGNASGRRYDHKRDVLLTAGLVGYHRKHSGVLGAAACWAMLYAFNVSRWLGWTILKPFAQSYKVDARAEHFRGVVRDFGQVWPKGPIA